MRLPSIFLKICILQDFIDLSSDFTVDADKILKEYVEPNEIPDDISFINIPEDGRLNFTELANKYGYACQEFDVTTEDGYVLKVFHIPGNAKKPVVFNHGLSDSSNAIFIQGNKSLALTLARNGFDVWAMNQRGNRYSRRHVTLDPDSNKRQFFNFSFNEIGLFDVPAVIDFVLESTGADALGYIGHSQGTTSLLVLTSERPEYNEKVNIAVMLAPSAFQQYAEGINTLTHTIDRFIFNAGNALGFEEVISHKSNLVKIFRFVCSMAYYYETCSSLLFSPTGYNPKQLTYGTFLTFLGQFPSGTSLKAGLHYSQLFTTKYFRKFDYGEDNYSVYGTESPPSYDLSKVTMRVALMYGLNDKIISIKDLHTLRRRLPNVVKYHAIEDKHWSHVDFMLAKDAHTYLNPYIIDLLTKYSKQ